MIGIDMKMPRTCKECQLESEHRRCLITGESIVMRGPFWRPDSCPLHPLDDEIRVGDEVHNFVEHGVVTFIWKDGDVDVVKNNGMTAAWGRDGIERTGRHFDEVGTLLKEIRSAYDG